MKEQVETKQNGIFKIREKLKQIIGSEPGPIKSHRGKGAFTNQEFQERGRLYSQQRECSSDENQGLLGSPDSGNTPRSPVTPCVADEVFHEIPLEGEGEGSGDEGTWVGQQTS